MPNPEKINLDKVNPEYRQELLKGRFSYLEREREKKKEKGMSDEEIEGEEKAITERQRLERQEEKEEESAQAKEEIEGTYREKE